MVPGASVCRRGCAGSARGQLIVEWVASGADSNFTKTFPCRDVCSANRLTMHKLQHRF